VIDSGNFRDKISQQALAEQFLRQGISPSQLEIGYHTPPWDLLRRIDISFDCFPHNSGTTLIESLYLGTPFITLADRPSIGRLGAAILEGIGHPEWIAYSEEEYIEKAVNLAADLPRLATIRADLRREMETSPLMDEPGFARKVEKAYGEMFSKWCKEQQ
jgi:predicted O-linked N-acetylglucosamine transferase (SPINDLY family)